MIGKDQSTWTMGLASGSLACTPPRQAPTPISPPPLPCVTGGRQASLAANPGAPSPGAPGEISREKSHRRQPSITRFPLCHSSFLPLYRMRLGFSALPFMTRSRVGGVTPPRTLGPDSLCKGWVMLRRREELPSSSSQSSYLSLPVLGSFQVGKVSRSR